MKFLLSAVGILVLGVVKCEGQIASLKATLEFDLAISQLGNGVSNVHAYDPLGYRSEFKLQGTTYQGFRIVVTQPLERYPNDPDRDSLGNYFIENPGVWKMGKQYVSFGAGRILKDQALAVTSDQTIAFLGAPISVSACDSGRGLPQGVLITVGGNYGVAVAVGHYFGISPTSLLAVRLSGDSPGSAGGYSRVVDAWYQTSSEKSQYWFEGAALRGGESNLAPNNFIATAGVSYSPDSKHTFSFSVSHDTFAGADFYAIYAQFKIGKSVDLVPLVRMRNGNLFDVSLSMRFRL